MQKKNKSLKINRKLCRHRAFKTAVKILFYAALPSEADLKESIRAALKQGRQVYLPSIKPKTHQLEVFRIKNLHKDLRPGPFSIMEPKRYRSRRANAAELDLVIVPGLGFTRLGRRLGRGAGYYDRFLARAHRVKKMGVAYREQICAKIPAAAHDVQMDEIITD